MSHKGHNTNWVAGPPTRRVISSRFKSLELRVRAVSALMAESEASEAWTKRE
jgi:hypothetical protein